MLNIKKKFIMVSFILMMGALVACGNGDKKETSGEEISGTIKLAGSSTVFPIMEYATYEFVQQHPNVNTPLESIGSGGGFKRGTKGEIDFANASRPIKEEERAIAEENGIELIETILAYDGLSVVVSQENDFVEELTVDQLREIFLAESGKTKWSDINPAWPDEDIVIYSPGHDSGTFDYFNEVILEEKPMREGEGVTLSEDDNLLVKGIQGDKFAIGFFGYAYYLANKDTLKVLGIDNGEGAVKPNSDTIQNGTYAPLSRPVFTYINKASLKENKAVQVFTEFLFGGVAAEAADYVGYVALPNEKYESQLEELKAIYQ